MDTETFWRMLDAAAKDGDKPLNAAVTDRLSVLPAEEILAFEQCFSRLRGAVSRWDVWAAAYLIGGGCSDDRFSDFRAGLVALGWEWYDRAAAHPDALADHPAVRAAAATGDQGVIFAEDFHFVSATAYERLTGDIEDFWEAWETFSEAHGTNGKDSGEDMGESFDFDDPQQMRQHLPRLAALYLGPAPD